MENIIDWFNENYIEGKVTIFNLVEEACIEHACTPQSLYEACLVMNVLNPEKASLRVHLQYFTKLANYGISGHNAGRLLHKYLNRTDDVGKELMHIQRILEK